MEIIKNSSRNISVYKYKCIKNNKIYEIFEKQSINQYIENNDDISYLNSIIKLNNNDIEFVSNICIKDSILFYNKTNNFIFCFKLVNFDNKIYSKIKNVDLYLIKNYDNIISSSMLFDNIILNITN